MTAMDMADKPFRIERRQVYEAYKAVKSAKGGAGADGQTIEDFEADLEGNLYKIWNRMSSGSYFPPPVLAVAIPKKTGGERILGCLPYSIESRRWWRSREYRAGARSHIPERLLRIQAGKIGSGCG
jgi:hypothetical protein